MKQIDTIEDYRGLGYPDQRKIARDSQGNLYVVYRKRYKANKETTYRIFAAKSTDNGASWHILNDNKPIEQTGDYTQRVPAIAIDEQDVIHVTWYGQDAANNGENERQIKYVRSTDGGSSWSSWLNVGEVTGYDGQRLWQEHPTLAAHGAQVYIAWQGLDRDNPDASQIRLVRSSDSGRSWNSWETVSPATRGNRSRPTIVAAPDGRQLFILAYGGIGTPQQILWTTSTDNGTTWAAWQPVAPNANDQRHISVALDGEGQLHALWRELTSADKAEIVYARFDGTGWSAPSVVQSGNANQFFPSVAIAGDNTVWAAWSESDESANLPEDDPEKGAIVVARKDEDSSWSILEPTGAQEGVNIYPSLRPNRHASGGTVDLVWLQQAGDRWQIMFSALDSWD